jgi:hypothetical protein
LLRDTGQRAEQWWKLTEQTFEFASTAQDRFANGDSQTKRQILATIGSNLILKDKKLWIQAKKPFFILEESLSGSKVNNDRLEPETIPMPQGPIQAGASLCLSLRGRRDANRTLEHRNKTLVKSIYTFYRRFAGSPTEIFPGWVGRERSVKEWRN